MSTVDEVIGGRYTLLDRNFNSISQPQSQDILQTAVGSVTSDIKMPNGVAENEDTVDGELIFTSGLSELQDSSEDDSTTDTDILLEEAKQYLELAKSKFVTLEDWNAIESKSRKIKVRDMKQ